MWVEWILLVHEVTSDTLAHICLSLAATPLPQPYLLMSHWLPLHIITQLLFIIYPQNNTLYSSLLSSQPRFSLVVRMSGVWWETCCESPGPESDWAWYDDTLTRICHVTTSIMSQWSLERGEEERPMNGRARTGARWALAWCEVCHCLYLPNQQSPLCHCPPPAVKMFECPHNTKLTRKWRQYTLFYTAPPHQAEHKWR